MKNKIRTGLESREGREGKTRVKPSHTQSGGTDPPVLKEGWKSLKKEC